GGRRGHCGGRGGGGGDDDRCGGRIGAVGCVLDGVAGRPAAGPRAGGLLCGRVQEEDGRALEKREGQGRGDRAHVPRAAGLPRR
ncbi:unnamed protein product, partial [Ectocarpus sp. 12 AP-2014]